MDESDRASKEPNSSGESATPLSGQKLIAIRSLTAKEGLVNAAKAADIHRTTLYRWMKKDSQFRAELNTWSHEQIESARLHFLGILDELAQKMAWKALNGWDKIALEIIRNFKVMKPPTGGDSADTVQKEIELEARQQEVLIAEQQAILRDKEIEHKERRLKRRALRSKLRKACRQVEAGNDPDRVNELGKNVAGGMDATEGAGGT